jgi:hypothetical protein
MNPYANEAPRRRATPLHDGVYQIPTKIGTTGHRNAAG